MKDLYTFDATNEQALQTYQTVRRAYDAFFAELKVPYLTAEASSGEIGGSLSHEYHFRSQRGEDNLVCCDSCDYVVNEELAESRLSRVHRHSKSTVEDVSAPQRMDSSGRKQYDSGSGPLGPGRHTDTEPESQANDGKIRWLGISQDRNTLVHASLPYEIETREESPKMYRKTEVNPYAIKRILPEIDLGAEDPLKMFKAEQSIGIAEERSRRKPRILRLVDMRCILQHPLPARSIPSSISIEGVDFPVEDISAEADSMIDLVRIETGDACPNCDEGALKVESAVELGHTFHLGTRYSTPLEATIDAHPSQGDAQRIERQSVARSDRNPLQMGCHGIGVSRLIAAVADCLADDKGLNWPRIIAPFEAIVVPTKGSESEAADVYDLLTTSNSQPIDAILDDRKKDFGWKMKDADMIGYPIVVILGRGWKSDRQCEVQCRRLSIKELVFAYDLKAFVDGLLQQL